MTTGNDDVRGPKGVTNRRAVLRQVAAASMLPLGAGLLSGCGEDGEAGAASTVGSLALAAESVGSAPTTSFTIGVLPDTQFYSRYATAEEGSQFQRKYGSEPFATQTDWLAKNAASYNTRFVVHLGDVVDQVGKPDQWRVAEAAMKRLEDARIPYSILAGNHDVTQDLDYTGPGDQSWGTDAQRTGWEPYLNSFPTSRAATQSTFRERDGSGWHEYHVFEAFGVQFMVLSLSWRISDGAIEWARNVIRRNPTLPVILSNHQLLNIDKDGISPLETEYGKMLWDRLIRDNDQIFMTLNGHHHGAARLTKINDFGNPVEEMVVDYQMAYQGGNALMRLYEFDFAANKIDVISFSPWVVQKPKESLNQFDRAVLTDPNEQFTIAINFKKRFAGFLKFKPTMTTTNAPILPRVTDALLVGFTQPEIPVSAQPRDVNDYPPAVDTYAHWRAVPGRDGVIVGIGERLTDVAGGNHMSRDPLEGTAELGDVVWSDDHHFLSSAGASVRFMNTNRDLWRLSSFSTAPDAWMNARDFWDGYTVEAFIKIDAAWTPEQHRWGNILARAGNRGKLPYYWGSDPQASPVILAISSLREVQWEVVPANDTGFARANWSGEIMRDTWYHIAIVNDNKTFETTLYVEGAPVLRNVGNVLGMRAMPDAMVPWILGATWWDGYHKDGFFGHLGEVRIVGHPTVPAQWLTARRT